MIFENPQIIRRGGFDSGNDEVAQSARAAAQNGAPIERPNNQFGAHRIVIRRDFVAGVNGGVGAHAGPAGE